MHFLRLLFLSVLLNNCATDTDNKGNSYSGNWSYVGLQNYTIHIIEKDDSGLFLGTNAGLFQLKIIQEEFFNLGLRNEKLLGIVRFSNGMLLAGTQASDFSSGDTTLFRIHDGVNNWEPFMSNFGGENGKYTYINKGPLKSSGISDTVWVRVGNSVARSSDQGNNWELIVGTWDSWGGAGVLFHIDPYRNGHLWIGGVSAFSKANLYKTVDNGTTWVNLTQGLSDNTEAVAHDAITFYKNEVVLVGLSGNVENAQRVKKSANGAKNWKEVYDRAGIYTFTHSVRNPEIVYASGINSQGRLFFIASGDFGDTWETVEFADSPSQIHVNDIVSVLEEEQEVLYLGTNKGVYSYRFKD